MIKKEYDKHSKFYEFFLRLDIPFVSNAILRQVYDKDFFVGGEKLKKGSAAKVAEIINEHICCNSVFDIGCGMGIYLEEFHRLGKDVLGCELSADGLKISPKNFTIFQADVTKPVFLNRRYDLVVCFEVAEHIPKKHSRQLVRNCTSNGSTIAFTSAPIGQGGIGHINEQPYEFWIDIFNGEGFAYHEDLSLKIRNELKQENVVYWIANNLMIFSDKMTVRP